MEKATKSLLLLAWSIIFITAEQGRGYSECTCIGIHLLQYYIYIRHDHCKWVNQTRFKMRTVHLTLYLQAVHNHYFYWDKIYKRAISLSFYILLQFLVNDIKIFMRVCVCVYVLCLILEFLSDSYLVFPFYN